MPHTNSVWGTFRCLLVVVTVAVQCVVHRRVGVAAAVVPGDVCVGNRVVRRLVWTHGSVDEQLQEVGPKHVPVVVVVLLAVLAAHDETTYSSVSEKCLVHGEVSKIFFDGEPFLRVEWLSGLDRVESGRWVGGVSGERIRR